MTKNVRRTALAAALLAATAGPLAWAAGNWSTLPIVGSASFCAAFIGSTPAVGGITGQGAGSTFCAQTVPAGPAAITGNELIPADTALSGGQPPQTVVIPTALLAAFAQNSATPRNLLRNGDISVNPFQRGTSQAADITTVATYGPDGFFFKSGTSTAINWSSQTGATDIVASQFTKSLRFQRKVSETGVVLACQHSILTSAESVALQGDPFVYSFWAKAGANFSAAGSNIIITVASGTGADESAANFATGAWTGYAAAVASTQAISTTWTQYQVAGSIPATATQVGLKICFTPVGTAGANDWIETSNHQLEVVATTAVVTPSTFAHQTPADALLKATRHFYRLVEPADGAAVAGFCQATGATANTCTVFLPTVMRGTTPTITITAAGGFKVNIAGTPTAFASATAGVCSITSCTVTGGNTNTAGQAEQLTGGGSTGKWDVSSEL